MKTHRPMGPQSWFIFEKCDNTQLSWLIKGQITLTLLEFWGKWNLAWESLTFILFIFEIFILICLIINQFDFFFYFFIFYE